MRAFIALDIDDISRDRFADLSKALRATAPRASWVDPAKMHLTLKFLGDIDDPAPLTEKLRKIPLEPMRPRIAGVNAFPSLSRARVIVVELEDEKVRALAAHFPDERPFRAHVTLARVRTPARWTPPASIDGEVTITALTLYESQQGAYLPISRFPVPTS
jgi:2'-5' RNA ligase